MHQNLAFVVYGPASVQLAIADSRLEGRRLPQLDRVHRLHVEMAIDDHRRRARPLKPLGIRGRMAARLQQLAVAQADALHLGYGPVAAAPRWSASACATASCWRRAMRSISATVQWPQRRTSSWCSGL